MKYKINKELLKNQILYYCSKFIKNEDFKSFHIDAEPKELYYKENNLNFILVGDTSFEVRETSDKVYYTDMYDPYVFEVYSKDNKFLFWAYDLRVVYELSNSLWYLKQKVYKRIFNKLKKKYDIIHCNFEDL